MAPGGGGPSLGDDDCGWLCREPAVLLPPRPCLCLSLARRPDQGAGSGTDKRPPALIGPCRDWRRCAALGTEAALSTPRSPATAHSQLWLGSAEGGCPGGTPEPPPLDRPLQAHASNVDAWPLGRHRPSTRRHGRGGVVSSSQVVGLAREQGGPPARAGATQSPCLRAGAPRKPAGAGTGVSHRSPRRACRPTSTPGQPKRQRGAPPASQPISSSVAAVKTREGGVRAEFGPPAAAGSGVLGATNAHGPEARGGSGVTGRDCNVGHRGWAQPVCQHKGALHVGACSGAHDGRAVQTRCLH